MPGMGGADPVSLAAGAVTDAAQIGLGIAQLVQSAKQNKEAKKLASKLVRPDYTIPQGYRDNQALAESMAGQGMSDAAREVYQNNANNTLTSSINAILRGGGDVNNISDLYGTANQKFSELAAIDDELRLKNQKVLMDANNDLSDQQVTQWQVNQYAPYQDQKQLIAKLRQQANDNKWKAANTLTSSIGNLGMSLPVDPNTSSPAAPDSVPQMTRVNDAGLGLSSAMQSGGQQSLAPYSSGIQDSIYTQELINSLNKNFFIK